jgi:long-subunit acyl-CoA synthetase (AMP-forming)
MPDIKAGIPCHSATIPQLIKSAAEHFGDKAFIIEGNYQLTFNQLLTQSRQLAAALLSRGFESGDRAAIWAPNMYQWVIAALGIQTAGGVLVTINTRYKGSEAADLLRRSSVTILFSVGDFINTNYPKMLATEDIGDVREIVVFNDSIEGHSSWEDFNRSGEEYLTKHGNEKLDLRIDEIEPIDLSDILFTSGTTGSPK